MPKPPVLLSRWYEFAKWLLERVDNFPKSQRFILGQRLVDGALDILELLVEAAYSPAAANRKLEVLRWIIRMAHERGLFTARQYAYTSEQMTECGRMLGGWAWPVRNLPSLGGGRHKRFEISNGKRISNGAEISNGLNGRGKGRHASSRG